MIEIRSRGGIGTRARFWLASAVWVLSAAGRVLAEDPRPAPATASSEPAILALFPPGIMRGSSAEWTVTGRNLAAAERFLISGEGVEVVAKVPRGDGSVGLTVRAADSAEPGFRELRADGPEGLSNLVLFRVDHLPQVVESEPNDDPAHATAIPPGTVAAGVLRAQDLDHFRIAGRAGRRVTIEVEARRLGTPIVPVVTLLTPSGAALAQGRPIRGGEHDARLTYRFPDDAPYVVQVRDNLYGGGDAAVYRLRVDEAPFATGLFPLGGPAGREVVVTASGGTLSGPRSRRVRLPDQPGATVEVGAFDGPSGPLLAPARLVAGDGPEVDESPAGESGRSSTRLLLGATANGRVERLGEVDRYIVAAREGEALRIKVQASSLGSWLDSVVTVRDVSGRPFGENDDPDDRRTASDSLLDVRASSDGDLVVEITDRFGEGGPEYAYRLSVGPARPDVSVALFGNPQTFRTPASLPDPRVPETWGSLNLTPGTTQPVRFVVFPEGRPGPITIRALGLPPGVMVEPVTVRPVGSRPPGTPANPSQPPLVGSLLLVVAPDAAPALGTLRVVAEVRLPDGSTRIRPATATLFPATMLAPFPTLPPTRVVTSLPVRVVSRSHSNPSP